MKKLVIKRVLDYIFVRGRLKHMFLFVFFFFWASQVSKPINEPLKHPWNVCADRVN